MAAEQGYELQPEEKVGNVPFHLLDVFVRRGREVRVGYTSSQDKVVHLHVNEDRVFPAGKWPTIDALMPRLVVPSDPNRKEA